MSLPTSPSPPLEPLEPLPYHRQMVALLKDMEPDLLRWASSADVRDESAEQIRTGLLKANYRLDAEGHPDLAERCAAMAAQLGIAAPVTLYQASGGLGANAMLCYLPGEAHLVFTGAILSHLHGAELDAVLAHELAHYRLWEIENGDFLSADRLLLAAAMAPHPASSHLQSARRLRLYTEIYADRGALTGCGDLEAAVAALVKTETGLPEVSAASYLKQADEIFARDSAATQGIDHPETYIRARALRLWSENDPALPGWLSETIEGPAQLDELDLLGQKRLRQLTERFLAQLLRPRWFRSAPVLAHAHAFFPHFTPASLPDASLLDELRAPDPAFREYLCYLLLDFSAVDRELEDLPLAAALQWSAQLDLGEPFEKLVIKELGLAKRALHKLKKDAPLLLEKAETEA